MDHVAALRAYRRQMARSLWLYFFLSDGFLWLLTAGSVCLALRMAGMSPSFLVWSGILIPVILGVALARVIRELPSPSTLRSFLDAHNRQGGLLMASEEIDVGAWDVRLVSLSLPEVKWPMARSISGFLFSASFWVLVWLAPTHWFHVPEPPKMDLFHQLAEAEQKIAVLEAEEILDQNQSEKLRRTLAELESESGAANPSHSWEALDQVNRKLMEEAERHLDEREGAALQQQALGDMMAALTQSASRVDNQTWQDAMQEMAELSQQVRAENLQFAKGLDDETLEALANADLSVAELEALAAQLSSTPEELAELREKLKNAGLIKGKIVKANKGADLEKAEAALLNLVGTCKNGSCDALKVCLAQTSGGSISRGPGSAELNWSHETNEQQAAFESKVLNDPTLPSLEQSYRMAVTTAAPEQGSNRRVAAVSGNRAAQGSGASFSHQILPKHRAVVGKYFEKKAEEPEPEHRPD
ncbi:hypothetical protein SCOR_16420 [Sulfidibacter corallicola]|uniref:Uncharacterized protein n=1 Tax=Sulfidibacter corallicola TaxID=2818388 RepID=A0A8A4TXY9_SULCO|nr:hypothetical protein [Sulfidibacter corallicola]QTD53954.1 hypothetical protein J3U87_16010 [Sulfidibacter corallicola]